MKKGSLSSHQQRCEFRTDEVQESDEITIPVEELEQSLPISEATEKQAKDTQIFLTPDYEICAPPIR